MSCEKIYNSSNVATGVLNKQGNPSKLFQQIVNNPHLNYDKALEVYSTVYELEIEPTLQYQNNLGQSFNSFSEALKTTVEGEVVAGVNIEDKFTELFRVNSDITTNDYNGLINNLVKSNLISGETEIDSDGKKLFKPVGFSEYKKAITSDSAITTARGVVGYSAKRDSAGNLFFNENLIGKRAITNKNDEVEYITQKQLDDKSYQQLKRTTSDPIGIMAERSYKENNRAFGDTTLIEEIEIIPENILQERLLGLLNSMGVKTVSLDNYRSRFDGEPSAEALADIANKIVAFKDGNVALEDLTEETAHFIVEATEANQLEDLLRNVHRTSEWTQFEESYRDIYSKKYSGAELEQVVRKEVLGKVLANSLQDNFAQNKASETQNSIIGRLRDLFNQFFERITAFFTPAYQQQLDTYTKGVFNNLMANSLYEQLDTQQLDGKKYVYYSIAQAGIPEQYKQLERTIDHLTSQQYSLQKKYAAPASQNQLREAKESLLKAIQATESEIEETSKLKALLNVATVANSQLNYLSRVIDKNSNTGYHFAQEENSVYQNFITKVEPLLSQLNNRLDPKNRAEKQIKDKIEQALKKSIELKGKVPASNEVAIKNLVNRVIIKNNLSGVEEQKFRDELTKVLTAAQKDTGWFHAHLGQLVHSQNILLNLAGDVIAKTVTDERRYFLPRIKNFLNQLEATGFNPRDLKKLIDGSGYIIHESDNSKLDALNLQEQTALFNEITGQSITEYKPELLDALSVEDRNTFNQLWNEKIKERLESFFTKEHLEKLENTFIEVKGKKIYRRNLPGVALDYEQYYRGQLTQIRVNNGGINTADDKAEIESLNKQRQEASNTRGVDGELKNGLREVYDDNLEQTIVEYDPSTITSDEDILDAQRIVGLQMINLLNKKFYEGTVRQEGIPETFIEKLNEFQTEQEKWDFVQLNAYIGFKPEYWDNFGQNKSLADRLQEAKDGSNNEEIDEIAEDIRKQQQIISNILKANRVFNQPSETNVTEMSDLQKSYIKDASQQLESLYTKANSFLEPNEQVTEPFSEARLNEAFRKDLADENITTDEEILGHILKHVTPKNRSAIDKAVKVAKKLKTGEETLIDKSLQNTFNENMSPEEVQTALMRFAENKLLPYYKRTEPIGYSQERLSLDEGLANNTAGTVEEFIKNTQFTQISPSYSFYGQSEAINPRWLANKEAKRPQYTQEFLAKIKNSEFYSRYGINEEGNPTQNLQEWNARQALLELQDWSIENYGLTGKHNRYLLPQQRKSGVRRVEGFLKSLNVANIREGLNDLVNFREDEGERGQDEFGNIVTNNAPLENIPQYGIRKIAEQDDVTDELLTSYSWFGQQSALYKSRRENIGDMLAIQDSILNSDFAGKDANATNTYKMFKSFLNNSFYGQRDTFSMEINFFGKPVNLGKLAKVFNSWTKLVSLFGISIPIVSLYQAKTQRFIESKVGEIINPIAMSLARKEFLRNAGASMAEVGKLNSKAKLNVLGEFFGLFNTEERFANSNYGKAFRVGLKLNSGLHALGNYPVLPTTLLSVIYDYRYVNGEILTYNQYIRKNVGRNKKEMTEEFKNFDLFYDDITTEGGVVDFKRKAISEKTGLKGEELDKRINFLIEAITNRSSATIQDLDQQIGSHEKSILSRDARANFLLNYMSWFTLAIQRKTKNYHYSISADSHQEGNWRTTYNFLEDLIIRRKDIKTAWNESLTDPLKRKNLKRTLIEMGVANALVVLAVLIANSVDDDDDPLWAVSYFNYILTRVATEQVSSTVALPRQIGEIIDNPIASAANFYDLFNVFDVFSSDQIQSGSYAGETLRYRWISKNIPGGREFGRLKDPQKALDTYNFYNKDVQDYAVLTWFLNEEEEE